MQYGCLVFIIIAVIAFFGIRSCITTDNSASKSDSSQSIEYVVPECTHPLEKNWQWDEKDHWHRTTCEHKEFHSPYEAHTFGPWKESDGKKTRQCTVCTYTETVKVTASSAAPKAAPKVDPAHVHTFATTWSYDDSSHWHAANCGHSVKEDEEPHSFGLWSKWQSDKRTRTCSECDYVQVQTR